MSRTSYSVLTNITQSEEMFSRSYNFPHGLSKWKFIYRSIKRAVQSGILECEELYRFTVKLNEKTTSVSFKGDGTIVSESEY
jgi:hypothetical protein